MKEVTYEDWIKNPTPRMMWVWDNDETDKVQRKVIYFIEKENIPFPVVALTKDGTVAVSFKHCAEIEKQRRMTNKELSWWLRGKPTREYKHDGDSYVYSVHVYMESRGDEKVDDCILIREGAGEWREPLVEVEE